MFDLWRAPDHVSRFDFLYRASPCLCPANASGHDQVLPCWVRVPSGPGPWLEGDIRTGKRRRIIGRKQRVDTDMAGKKFGRPMWRKPENQPEISFVTFCVLRRPVHGPQQRLLKRGEQARKAWLCMAFSLLTSL